MKENNDDIKTSLDSIVNDICNAEYELFNLEPKVQSIKTTVILKVGSIKEVYVQYDESGLIKSILFENPVDESYSAIKLTNETLRGAVREFLLQQDPIIQKYKNLKSKLQCLKLNYDHFKVLINGFKE